MLPVILSPVFSMSSFSWLGFIELCSVFSESAFSLSASSSECFDVSFKEPTEIAESPLCSSFSSSSRLLCALLSSIASFKIVAKLFVSFCFGFIVVFEDFKFSLLREDPSVSSSLSSSSSLFSSFSLSNNSFPALVNMEVNARVLFLSSVLSSASLSVLDELCDMLARPEPKFGGYIN